MSFQPLTEKLIAFIKEGQRLNNQISPSPVGYFKSNIGIHNDINLWIKNICRELYFEGEKLMSLKIQNLGLIEEGPIMVATIDKKCSNLIRSVIDELIQISEKIEERKENKTIQIITIDDIDNFSEILKKVKDSKIDSKFYLSAFLEDDVENTFLEILDEPYKENDSGSEMRDLYTSNIVIKGKRVHSAIMFKGRGVKKTLNISDCGKNGNQLLKLAKNTTAQLYIIQHVNKIESEVIEALKHHLLAFSQVSNIIICTIDGKDTARLLVAAGKDLEYLMTKKNGT